MTTEKLDNQNSEKVAAKGKARTPKSTTAAPLVGAVTAGAMQAAQETAATTAPEEITLQSILKGLAGSPKGLPKSSEWGTEAFLKTIHNMDVAEFEGDLVLWMRGRKNQPCPYEDVEYIEDYADGDESCDFANFVAEYLGWREARRQFCAEVRKFLAYIDADEAKRQKEEAPLLKA